MEYFRHHISIRIIAVLLTIVLQLDVLDYLISQVSIPDHPFSEQLMLDTDDSSDEGDDTNFSLLRNRSLKNVLSRVCISLHHGVDETFGAILKNHFYINLSSIVQLEPCSLRTLFCVFRI